MKLDITDKRILSELELDAMQPYSSIAKKVKTSKEVVRYRIEKMINSGLIEQFVFIINTKLFGYTPYKLYLQLENVDDQKQKEILEHLMNHPFCVWLVTCSGRFDVVVAFFAESPEHYTQISQEFLSKFSGYVRDTTNIMMMSISHFKRRYLTGETEVIAPEIAGEIKFELSEEEIKILKILSKNARKSFVHISKETGLSLDVVRYQYKKMKKNGVIQGSRLGFNKEMMGFEYHKILLSLKNITPDNHRSLLEFFNQNTNTVDVVQTFGNWDMEVDIDVKNSFQLHKIILQLKNKFPELIRRYETIQIFKEHRYDFFPMGDFLLKKLTKKP